MSDFAIDLSEKERLIKEGLEQVKRVREEITESYKGKELIAARIKVRYDPKL